MTTTHQQCFLSSAPGPGKQDTWPTGSGFSDFIFISHKLIFHAGGHTLYKNTSPFFKKRLCTYTCDQPVWACVCVCTHVHACGCMHTYAWLSEWVNEWSSLYLHEAHLIYEDLCLQKGFPFFSSCSKSLKYYTILCLASPFKELWRHEAPQKSEFIVYLRRCMTDSKQTTSNIWHQV